MKLVAHLALLMLIIHVQVNVHAADKAGVEAPRKPPLLGVVHTQAPRGVLVQKIIPESAAERAGLKAGDVILRVNSTEITNPRHLFTEVQKYTAGTIVSIDYVRAGQKKNVQIALGARLDTASLVGTRAPDIALPSFGSPAKFAPTTGKVQIIDFWATWCAACEPVRQRLEDFKRAGKNANIGIIGVTTEDAATVKTFYKNRNPPYPILLDTANDITLRFRVEGYPTLAVVDKQGIIRFAGFASDGGLERALALAAKLAAE